jgi:hypothetical protein
VTSLAGTLSLLLSYGFPAVLAGGSYFAYRAKQRETPRVSTAMWRQERLQVEEEAPAKRSYPMTRVIVALAGSALLGVGSLLPSSTLVRSAAISTPETGSLLYLVSALLAVPLAVSQRFRPLYLAGGIPLLLLVVVGIESTFFLQKYPAYAQGFYGESYGLGWGWILMVTGAGLILFSAILHPAEGGFYKTPPRSASTQRQPPL